MLTQRNRIYCRLRRLWRLALLVLCLWCPSALADIYLLLTSDADYYQETAHHLRTRLSAAYPELNIHQSHITDQQPLIPSDSLIVPVGSSAITLALRQYPQNPMLALFVTTQAWRDIRDDVGKLPDNKAVIFIDQPFARYVELAGLLLPEARTYSTVLGPATRHHRDEISALVESTGRNILLDEISLETNPTTTLNPLIRNSDLFIAIPDQGVFNRNVAKWALYLSYQQKVPIIGFSSSYTRAGALASLFSAPADVGSDGSDWIQHYLQHPDSHRNGEQWPGHFSVEINPSVARILGVDISAVEDVTRQLKDRLNQREAP